MNNNELDKYEQEILDSFEKGEWVSVGDKNRLEEIQFYAKNTLSQEYRLSWHYGVNCLKNYIYFLMA